jgi:hypothetical protein
LSTYKWIKWGGAVIGALAAIAGAIKVSAQQNIGVGGQVGVGTNSGTINVGPQNNGPTYTGPVDKSVKIENCATKTDGNGKVINENKNCPITLQPSK